MTKSVTELLEAKYQAPLVISTLGKFEMILYGTKISGREWKRDKSLQLFQFMLISRNRKSLHKEQIMDRLWNDEVDDQGFKVALHGINKVLEPKRKSHSETNFIERVGSSYRIMSDHIWLDTMVFEDLVSIGNKNLIEDPSQSIKAYEAALSIHQGQFLPDRIFEDWSSDERERLQLLYLNAAISYAELLLDSNPAQCIQICQEALIVDVTWEDAYRVQMEAFYKKGNRPMAIKTYQVCEKVLSEEMGLKPLPETKKLYESIRLEM